MKKQISFSFLTVILFAIFSLPAAAQQANNEINTIASVSNTESVKVNARYVIEKRPDEYQVSTNIEKNFSKIYPDAISSEWTKIENGSLVNCIVDGEQTTAVFQENGKMKYSITRLNEANIPASLQDLIKKDYTGFHILKALKINNNGNITHQVILGNAESYVTIKFNGEEIEVTSIKNASGKKYN
jgi:hypothetical protein